MKRQNWQSFSSNLSANLQERGKTQSSSHIQKVPVYKADVVSTLLSGSEIWITYSHQERKLNTFHAIPVLSYVANSVQQKSVAGSE